VLLENRILLRFNFPAAGRVSVKEEGGQGGGGLAEKHRKGMPLHLLLVKEEKGAGGGGVLMGNHKQGVLLQVLLVKEERGRVEGMEEGEETEEEREFPKMIICAF